ncbi:MAG: succinate dehydrogenase cytochrome b subunit [Chitinophagales bacterium]
MANSVIFKSSIGKKFFMSLTGLFLITFLIVHATINGMIWFNDGGVTFSHWAHFMGTNLIIRTMELVLVAGFLVHIVDGLMLWAQNRAARPVKYSYNNPAANSSWYSRSMGLLGTLILLFLIIHASNFWIPNRYSQFATGEELNLFQRMQEHFQSLPMVLLYVAGCFSLFWHLLHGFKSAFQTLGFNHLKYNRAIELIGAGFAVLISVVFALMPISMFFGLVK